MRIRMSAGIMIHPVINTLIDMNALSNYPSSLIESVC